MRTLPLLYWKVNQMLKQDGLDDETLAVKFRLSKKDAKQVRKEIEWWFGKEPDLKTKPLKKNNGDSK